MALTWHNSLSAIAPPTMPERCLVPMVEELLTIQAATAMEDGLVSPAHLVVDTFPSEQGSQRVNEAGTLHKAPKRSPPGHRVYSCAVHRQATAVQAHAQALEHDLQKLMRRFGRQC